MTIDVESLIDALMSYYGTAMSSGFPMAVIDLGDVENASPEELVKLAQQLGLNLRNFAIDEDYER